MKKAPPRWRYAALLCFAFLVVTQKTSAQVETDTSFRYQMNTIFGPLDKSKVPYGILRDFAMEFTNLECYNGTTSLVDSNQTSPAVLRQAYYTLLSGRISNTASGFVKADTLEDRWFNARQAGIITLAGLFFNYSRFKDDAYPNYITVTSNKLYDKYVSSVWQNPYQEEKAFVISPSINEYDSLICKVVLPSSLWLSNSSYSAMSINFNDGLGYRTVTPDSPLTVSYSTAGLKEWLFRIQISGGTWLYSHAFVTMKDPATVY